MKKLKRKYRKRLKKYKTLNHQLNLKTAKLNNKRRAKIIRIKEIIMFKR